MANLTSLNLALCNITGSLTAAWGASFNFLTLLTLSSNQLTGALPGEWGTSSGTRNLTDLEVDSNQLSGQLPPSWGTVGSFSQLQKLNLASNNLTGTLSAAWGQPGSLPDLQILQGNNNNFTGQLPDSWAGSNALSQLGIIYLQGNSLTGGIPLSWANNRSSMLKYLRPGNQGMCEPIRARLGGSRTFGTTTPALSCLDAGCQDSDITSALALGNTQDCQVTIAADGSITSTGCPSGAVQQDAAANNLAGRFVIANQTSLTLTSSVLSQLQSVLFSSNAGSCLAGAVLVNSDSALYLEGVAFNGNQAMGDRGGGGVLLYGNSSLHATSSSFTGNAATAANLYVVDATAMAAGARPSEDAVPTLWCGAVGGVPGIDSLYGINDLASNHLLGGYSGTTPDPTLGQGGGAVYAASFNVLNITSSTFSGNTASRVNITDFKAGRGAGGAISINSDALITSSCSAGLVSITGCTFSDNTANSGGAVQLAGAGHTVSCHTSGSNVDYGKYNASYLDSLPYASYSFCGLTAAFCVISNTSFDGNSALLGGGALSVLQGYSVQLNNVSFQDSSTPMYGGAIAVANGSAVITNGCTFTDCSASEGGAIYATASSEGYIAATVIPQWRDAYIYASDVYKLGRQMGSLVNLANSSFVGNVASNAGGAVYMSGDNQLVSQGNTFVASQAGAQGGALYLSNTCQQLSASDTFSSNSAQQGGAVAILSPALDSGRYILSAVSAGGAASIQRLPCGVVSALANATFRNNQAELSGGAVYVVSTPSGECRTMLDESLLAGNYAVNGGAFFAGTMPCFMVSNTNFTGNSGTNGGAMAMQSTTNATFSGITAVGNSAGCGGGMFVDRAASIQVVGSNFSRNTAMNGAGFAIQQVTSMSMNNLSIMSNSASELGGAIYSIQPSISIQDREALNVADDVFSIGDLLLDTVNMSLNTANQGGCMYVTGNGANVTAVNSNFDSCIAGDVGGGLMCENCPQVYMTQVIFSGNQAQASAGGFRCEGCLAVILEQVQFLNNSAVHGGGLDINATLPNPVIIVGSQFTYNSARVVTDDDGDSNLTTVLAGNGGGVRCLGGNLYLIDDSFDDNTATNGAAVYAVQGCGQADSYTSGYCSLLDSTAATAVAAAPEEPSSPSVAVAAALRYAYILDTSPNCSAIRLSQTEFYGNKAIGGGGGAIFWDGPVADLVISCSDMEDASDVEATTNSSTLPGTCSDWEGNNSTLGFGGDLASEAAAINASESEQAPITAFASGGVLPSLMFDIIDHFGNLVSGGVSAASMLVSATSSNAILGGQQLAQAVDGVVTFDGLIITANSTMNTTSTYGLNYTVTFAAASISGISSWDVAINIRGCEPGEQYDNNVCRVCQEQTYSFHPGDDGGQCQTCPDTAHCPGGPIFVPDDYYWHSAFDSDTAQRCPNTFACSLSADTSSLVTTTSSTQRSDLLEACQTAWYNGTTSSTPELNPDRSFEDIICVTPSGNVSYQNAQCQTGYNGLLCTNCDNGWGNSRTFHCNQCMSSVPTNTFLIFLGHLASFCYVAWLVRGSLASAAQVGRAEADHFEQFSDMMKVLTTNLQTNGIIAGLNINWPSSLRSIQNIFNVVQSSMVNTVSMDCSLQYWDSPIMAQAQIEAVIAMLVPIGMLGIFLLMWTCRWAYLRKYGQLTDITGQPISRASSASSARSAHAFQDLPKQIERSLTRDSDLSDSGSSESDELREEADQQTGDFIPAGQLRSEEESAGTVLDAHSMAARALGQSLEQRLPAQKSQPHAVLGSFKPKGGSKLGRIDSRQVKKRASWSSFSRRSKSCDGVTQDGQEQGFLGAGQSRSEDGSPRTTLEDVEDSEEAVADQEMQGPSSSSDRPAMPAYNPPVETRDRKPGSTRFALDASDVGSAKASTAGSTKSRLGQSALKRGNTMSPSVKGPKRVMLATPNDDLEPAQVSLEIQEAATDGADAWPYPRDRPQGSRLMPSKSSLKSAGSSKRRSGLSSARFSSLRFSLEPQHHIIAVSSQGSMSSDHSTLSASFKSFRSIPSRLSQFGSQQSLRWTLATDQSIEFWAYCKRRFITTAVVLAYFMYPDLSENIANIFSCYPVQFGTYSDGYTGSETQYYWTQDTTEVCFSNNHFWTALLLGVPGVLIVCLGIPAWFAGVLYRGRHDLDNLSLQRTYGFLYLGYKHKYYWWESSLLLRNLLLVAVVYLGPALGVYIQAHIVLLIMIVSLVLHAYTRPFKERVIDNMEFVSIGSITLVMYLSLYFLDVEQGLSSRMQWVLGFILLTLIAGTCLWFLFNVFRRKEVLVALLKSTTVTATRGLNHIKTLVKSDRLRSMVTRSTDRSASNATLTSNATMTSNAEQE
ncbi:hypothetical protein WJX82_005700 [Trebouxia sp. C0006]